MPAALMVAAKIEDVERMIPVADVSPHLPRQRLARHRLVEVRHLGRVGVDHPRAPHLIGHPLDQRLKHRGDVGHPAAHGRAGQVDAVPAEDAFQAMQRQMIRVLAGADLGQQARPRQALVDDRHRHRRDGDMVMTLRAGVLETHVLPDEQAGRLVIELLADLLAELRTDFAAARAEPLGFGQRVLLATPRQVRRQFLAAVTFAFGFRGRFVVRCGGGRRRFGGSGASASSGSSQGWFGSKRSALGP